VAIILDTDVIIHGEKETFDLKGWLAARFGEQVEIAAITVAELWHGVERANAANRDRREQYVRSAIEGMLVIPYTEATALEHARIWAELESSGKMIGYYDLIVAATALERGSAVVTFNERHFLSVPGLKVIKPK
jgi:tRNA(fMet)-specific endonuclease VapC